MPIPTIPDPNVHYQTDREKVLAKSEWSVEVNNPREMGEAIASYWRQIDSNEFIGMATMSLEGTIRKLELVICFDEEARLTCDICHRVPSRPTSDNPGICTMCGRKVCSLCWKAHERDEWRPKPKSIGGTPF